jgi:predicted TIM-barrel fold metal-dependent hydrolase
LRSRRAARLRICSTNWRPTARGHNIIATIFAECTEGYLTTGPEHLRSAGETAFAAQIGQQADARNVPHWICAGIISYADLRQGAAVEEVLDAHLKAGAGRFRGIGQSTAWDRNEAVRTTIRTPPEGVRREPAFREGFAVRTRMGLTFDSWVYLPQLSDVADLARAFPDANIILDHVGGPIGIGPYAGMRDEVLHVWEKGIRDIASWGRDKSSSKSYAKVERSRNVVRHAVAQPGGEAI